MVVGVINEYRVILRTGTISCIPIFPGTEHKEIWLH